jgi:hypothetical protein
MKPILAALAGFALIGAIGATQVNAQSVRVNIEKGNKRVQISTGERSTRADFREPVQTPKKPSGHYITVTKKVWVPGHYITEHKDVWVPARYEVVRERRVDACGNVFYVSVKKLIPGHYECREVKTYVPGHYKTVQEKVWVEDECGCDGASAGGHGKGHAGKGKPPAHANNKGKNRGRGRGRG